MATDIINTFVTTIIDLLRTLHGFIIGFSPANEMLINLALAGVAAYFIHKEVKDFTYLSIIIGTLIFITLQVL